MHELKKKLERYLRVNLFGPGPRLMKKRIYRAAVSQRLRNTDLDNGTVLQLLTEAVRQCHCRNLSPHGLPKNLHEMSLSVDVTSVRIWCTSLEGKLDTRACFLSKTCKHGGSHPPDEWVVGTRGETAGT